MKQPSRQTLSNWEDQAVSFLCDITEQVPIPGLEDDTKVLMSKLGRDEAKGMLADLAGALQMDWPEFLLPLSKAWRRRRKAKCKSLGWYEPGEHMNPAQPTVKTD